MNSHNADGVRVGVLVVLPSFRVGVLGMELEEVCKTRVEVYPNP
jgi:hypothetical protein